MSATATAMPAAAPARDRVREAEERILEWAEETADDLADQIAEAAKTNDKYPMLRINAQPKCVLLTLVREWQQERFARAGGRR